MNISNPIAEYKRNKNRHRIFQKLAYPVGLFSLLASIPQIVDVWVNGNTEGLSPWSWGSWVLGNLFWIGYGIVDNDRPIFFLYSGWLIVNGLIFIGIFAKG